MSEATEVQFPLIQYVTEIGWEYLLRAQAVNLRADETELFLTPILQAQAEVLGVSVEEVADMFSTTD